MIGSGKDLLPFWCLTIIWTNDCLLSIVLLETNFREIWIKTLSFISIPENAFENI